MSLEWFRQQLRELAVDRSRTVLVALGVLWGTLSLTVVLSFGDGLHLAIMRALRASGHNILLIWSGSTTMPHRGLPAGRWIGLLPGDAQLVAEQVPGVRSVSVEYASFGNSLERGEQRTNGRVHGVNPAYGELRQIFPRPGGRFLNERDEVERRRVVFISSTMERRLFGDTTAVGETVKIWGMPFQVIGVMIPKLTMGNYEGYDEEKVFIPASTFKMMRGWRYLSYMVIGAASPDDDQHIVRGLYRNLGARHGFDPGDEPAITIYNQIDRMDRKIKGIIAGTRILMGIVGVLGLLVALIGVANITYVLVEERRREIGIQMALGARPARLMAGFLFEALVLTFTGGAIGILASTGILWGFNMLPLEEKARGYLGQPELSLVTALVVCVVLGAAGCVAGYVPARRAVVLDPIQALREE